MLLLVLVFMLVAGPLLVLACLRFLDGPEPRAVRAPGFAGWLGQSKTWHVAVALLLTAFILLATFGRHGEGAPIVMTLLVLLLLGVAVRAWRHQLLFLMALRDNDFPGRHDKLIWALLIILLPPVGLWLFRSYRAEHWPEAELRKAESLGELL